MARVSIGSITEFIEGRGVPLQVAGRRLAIFRVGQEVFAIDNNCPHRNFPLHDGVVREASVSCRTHGSCFNLRSGAVERGPASRGVRTYPAFVVGEQVEVEMPD